jgi:hypothetical protein
MASWKEISNDPDYQSLPESEKRKVADGFYSNTIGKDPDFLSLPDVERDKVRSRFYMKAGFAPQEQKTFMQKAEPWIKGMVGPDTVAGRVGAEIFKLPIRAMTGLPGTQAITRTVFNPIVKFAEDARQIAATTPIAPVAELGPKVVKWAAKGMAEGGISPLDVLLPFASRVKNLAKGAGMSADEIAQVVNRARLVEMAPPHIKTAEAAKLEAELAERLKAGMENKIPVQRKAPPQVLPQPPRQVQPPIPKPAEWLGADKARAAGMKIPAQKPPMTPKPQPFTIGGTIPEADQAAMQALKKNLPPAPAPKPTPFTIGGSIPDADRQALDAMKAKLPPAPAVQPQAAVSRAVGEVAEDAPPFKDRILAGLRAAKKARREQDLINQMEWSQRTARLSGVETGGEAAYLKKKAALKGEFDRAEYESIRQNFTQNEVDQMFSFLDDTPKLAGEWERLNAQTALTKLLGVSGAKVPTNAELKLLSKVYGDELVTEIMDKRHIYQKIWDTSKDVLNLPRALMATLDVSMPLRQGIVLGAGNPKRYAEAFKEMFKYAFDEKAYDALQESIRRHPNYDLMKKAGVNITELGKLGSKEEQFVSNLAEQIPGIGKLVRASSRAASGFLNKLRSDVFNDLLSGAKAAGALTDDEVVKNIARLVNIGTGRGEVLDSLRGATEALNATLFSPKLVASRLQMLNPKTYMQMDPFTRKQMLLSMRNFVGAGMTALGLAKAAGAEVGVDPRSADFGKIKIGDTRYDIWGGFQQYAVLAARLATGEMVSTTTNREFQLDEGYKAGGRLGAATKFLEYKTAPIASFVIGALRGKNAMGEEFDVAPEVLDRFIPMIAQDYYDLSREWGPVKAAGMTLPGAFGVGSQTYGENIPVREFTKTGREKVKWQQAPSLGETVVRKVTGSPLSNIPESEMGAMREKRKAEQQESARIAEARERVADSGNPEQVGSKWVYLDRGMVKTKDLAPVKDLKKESLIQGMNAELRSLDIPYELNAQQAEYLRKNIVTNPQYKTGTRDQKRELMNRIILGGQR